ncbi:nitroreductase family deazaflavin-dependent oxidoreductase [Rhodococcus sp. PAM 2766]|uniref:Nitroreductase family deazaflavin-dependent oxidoreductase n=1 Tax=Rhodococcus parequi TaxID=3137122 RepID=A0ABW9FMG5_9NOCA
MAYLKPPLLVREVFNRIALATGISGTEKITVTGRRSHEPRSVPVVPVDVDGVRYLVSTRGESEWVRNLRASPEVDVSRRGHTVHYNAAEVPIADRDPIIAAYRAKAGRTVQGYWEKLPEPVDHPVFALTTG